MKRVAVTGDGPDARIGAKAVLVGNAFIVFGGSSRNPAKSHDSSLCLLNTATKIWSRTSIGGVKPASRIGHTFNVIGAKIWVFGGQPKPSSKPHLVSNDLWAFDINTLFAADAKWTLVTKEDGPCPRMKQSAVTYLGKLCK